MTIPVENTKPGTVEPLPKKDIFVDNLSAWYGRQVAISDISLSLPHQKITAIIGPSGCGKSTFIRCLNRMHEVIPGTRVSGRVLIDGQDIYAAGVDPVRLRRRIGMVFQRPNPFPTMSIFDNVAAGLKLGQLLPPSGLSDRVEKALRQAALWDEVKDKLNHGGTDLSGGQQQRLCIARALAVEPEILLMDEPCSALDPVATLKIEDLMRDIVEKYTIVIVTHNMQQAARVSDMTAFFMAVGKKGGTLIEYDITSRLFSTPKDKHTEDYITGRFG